jgi:uncharacterized protein YaeQ
MALKATIFKAELQVSDLDRHYFATHSLTIARHPSETDERMMVRSARVRAQRRTSTSSSAAASRPRTSPTWCSATSPGAIELWIEVGLPDEREVRKASGRARAVKVYTYGGRSAAMWWDQNRAALARLDNLTVVDIPVAIGNLAARNMSLQCTIQDGQLYLSTEGEDTLHFEPTVLS